MSKNQAASKAESVHAESLFNWAGKHVAEFQQVGADLADVYGVVQKVKADFPAGDISILSQDKKDQVVSQITEAVSAKFAGLPPGVGQMLLNLMLPLILKWLGLTPPGHPTT